MRYRVGRSTGVGQSTDQSTPDRDGVQMLVMFMLMLGGLTGLDESLPRGRRLARRPGIALPPAAVRAVAA